MVDGIGIYLNIYYKNDIYSSLIEKFSYNYTISGSHLAASSDINAMKSRVYEENLKKFKKEIVNELKNANMKFTYTEEGLILVNI